MSDDWLDRLEQETCVWSITRDYARCRIVAPGVAAVGPLWQEVAGATHAGAVAQQQAELNTELVQWLGWWFPPRGMR